MHQYTRDEAGSLIISPCKQDTDQECRKDLGRIDMKNAEQKSPEHIFHGGTVPQAAQCEHDQHVDVGARFALAAAAEREMKCRLPRLVLFAMDAGLL